MARQLAASALVGIAVVMLAGCGLGPGPGTSDVSVTVTRDFGRDHVGFTSQQHVPGSETVMRMLERFFRVQTRYGGGFVESIDGLSGDQQRHDWFYYVNGIEAPKGAAVTPVHRGDRIWWDLHDWSAAEDVPAVVGSFPEPFIHGSAGKRLPTTLECAGDVGQACQRVTGELEQQGVPVAVQEPGTGSGTDSLTIVVGTWGDLRSEIVADLVDRGPSASGVYARFNGDLLELLDENGRVARTLGAGAGLVAATAQNSSEPIWLVAGTDPAGALSAADALTPARLHDDFALAVQGDSYYPLPRSVGR